MIEESYNPEIVEQQAQQFWKESQSFKVTEDLSKEKFYALCMFPYPSGQLHMGHVRNYTIGDVIARHQRMLGKNVLQPIGWDAFGLPAENAAIEKNVAPSKWTYENIDAIRSQFKRFGFAYDWKREITTCKPEYYRWEQWLFVKLFEKGLAYKKNSIVNWDPVDKTVLANEQVIDGRGWRSGALVERREIPQWFLKITAYADELLEGLDQLEHWPDQVRTMQRNWIGRSEGVEIYFDVAGEEPLEVFTTRPDTLMGATYVAIAPQHPLALQHTENNPDLKAFIEECSHIQVAEAALATMEKKGIDLGITAKHPITGEELPIWVANFVVMEYGSGAVMSVPAHDQRDFKFAKTYQLPIKQVITPTDGSQWDIANEALIDKGILINSGEFTDLTSENAFTAIADYLQRHKHGQKKIHYRLRDWGVSRQRYWGAPIPIIHCHSCGAVPVPEKDLPVVLPEDVQFDGATSPLKNIPEFYQTACPNCQEPATRETDTFDTFVESSWYFARYACVNQEKAMLDARAKYWMPVDHYIGGVEHAVMHLLYARFINKTLRDEGLLNCDEPFKRLLTQGMVLKDGAKMSKSRGNVVEPTALVNKYGADTARLFAMFASPPEQSLEWSDSGVDGAYRFLKRIWTFAADENGKMIKAMNKAAQDNFVMSVNWEEAPQIHKDARREIHQHLQQARYDYDRQQFNTVVSACMKIFNLLSKVTTAESTQEQASQNLAEPKQMLIREGFSILLRLLSPIAPHITHHLWRELAYGDNILTAKWPKAKVEALQIETTELIVQVNGKLRAKISVPVDADKEVVEQAVFANELIKRFVADKTVQKTIVIPNKLINVVVTE